MLYLLNLKCFGVLFPVYMPLHARIGQMITDICMASAFVKIFAFFHHIAPIHGFAHIHSGDISKFAFGFDFGQE